jgi:hypothetical protein
MSIAKTSGDDRYLLAGQASELERLQLQSRVWEPSGRQLLAEIGDGRGPSPGRWLIGGRPAPARVDKQHR